MRALLCVSSLTLSLRRLDGMSTHQTMRQFVRYVLVGGMAFVVDFTALFFLTEQFGLHYLISASISFMLGLLTNYLLCIAWIFDYRALKSVAHEFFVFFLIGVAGLLLNNLLMFILTEFIDLHYLVSKAAAAAAILFFNFFFRRSLLFTERPCPNVLP